MLGADVVVVEALSLLLRKLQDLPRPLGEFIEAISHLWIYPVPRWETSRPIERRLHHPGAVSITLDGDAAGLVVFVIPSLRGISLRISQNAMRFLCFASE